MISAVALAVFLLASAGVYLLLERRLFRSVLGLVLLAHAANLVVLSSGGWAPEAPVLGPAGALPGMADPLPQALVLTAIVISMALTIYLLALVAASGRRGILTLEPPPESDEERDAETVSRELSGGGR